jgi:hypothetical protein
MSNRTDDVRPLGESERRWIADQIAQYLPLARNERAPVSTWARHLIKDAFLWYWTADGLNADGIVQRDALKSHMGRLKCSMGARQSLDQPGVKLIHEHAVPRKVVRDELLRMVEPSGEEVYTFLMDVCIPVIITEADNNKLNDLGLKQRMPGDTLDRADPFARYNAAEIDIVATPIDKSQG